MFVKEWGMHAKPCLVVARKCTLWCVFTFYTESNKTNVEANFISLPVAATDWPSLHLRVACKLILHKQLEDIWANGEISSKSTT